MTEETKPFHIDVGEVKENEDGSATYTFVVDDAASKEITTIGLKFILYCSVAKVNVRDALDWILNQAE